MNAATFSFQVRYVYLVERFLNVAYIRQLAAWIVLAVALTTLGCSDGGNLSYAPTVGVVTVDGKPIEGAQVVLLMDEPGVRGPKPTSRGSTDANGRFVLKTLTPEKTLIDGAVVGKHHVQITTRVVEQDPQGRTHIVREELLAPTYTTGQELTVDIPSTGVEDLRFDLPRGLK